MSNKDSDTVVIGISFYLLIGIITIALLSGTSNNVTHYINENTTGFISVTSIIIDFIPVIFTTIFFYVFISKNIKRKK